jgi:release factor glutamine methyltransferase
VIHDIRSAINACTSLFQESGFSDAKREAENLLCECLDLSRADLYTSLQRPLSEGEWLKAQEWMTRRLQGEPLAYIAGKVRFYDCLIEVNQAVLIPRLETEILVDKILSSLNTEQMEGRLLLDLCCGSGCIGIALKKKFPSLIVYLSDCSEEALRVAARNAIVNQVNVNFLKGDLLEPFHEKKADFIVCNPPYISTSEYEKLDKDVKNYEPRLALEAGKTGLEFYERLARKLPKNLSPGGKVWFEIGYAQGPAIEKLFQGNPWKACKVENDWAGHNRFFFLEIE